MNVDWGKTPFTGGAARGIAMALLIGFAAFLDAFYRQGLALDLAVGEGMIPAVAAFIALLAGGSVDQLRANARKINAADVPVYIEAQRAGSDPKLVAREMTREVRNR